MKWVMIIIAMNGTGFTSGAGKAIGTAEFENEVACVDAKIAVERVNWNRDVVHTYTTVRAVCVAKGKPE